MDWFKEKSWPETKDFPSKYRAKSCEIFLQPIHWSSMENYQPIALNMNNYLGLWLKKHGFPIGYRYNQSSIIYNNVIPGHIITNIIHSWSLIKKTFIPTTHRIFLFEWPGGSKATGTATAASKPPRPRQTPRIRGGWWPISISLGHGT